MALRFFLGTLVRVYVFLEGRKHGCIRCMSIYGPVDIRICSRAHWGYVRTVLVITSITPYRTFTACFTTCGLIFVIFGSSLSVGVVVLALGNSIKAGMW
jgi:hypothetical protein